MSIMAKSNVYESIVDDGGLNDKLCFATCDATRQFMFMPKIESNVDPNMLDAPEIMVDQKNIVLNDGIICDTYNNIGEPVYHEESLNSCEEIEIEYKPSFSSLTLREPKMEDGWEENNQYENSPMQKSSFEENQMPYDVGENIDDPDEETIATFLTAAGQRLALYAVEDSDEVFAVAVYDESGEPPTNFQFLMKSDVERLIGEGAVRTVKKPTQIKKQLFQTDPPVFAHDTEANCDENPLDDELVDSSRYKKEQHDAHNSWEENAADVESDKIEQTKRKSSPLPDVNEQSFFAYVTMENTSTILPSSPPRDFDRTMENIEEKSEIVKDEYNDGELVEQSTVQHLFMDYEKTDDELTFADIEETLRDLGKKDDPPSLNKISPSQSSTSIDIIPSIHVDSSIDVPSSINVSPSIDVAPSEDHQILNGIMPLDNYCDVEQKSDAPTEDIVTTMNALKKPEKNKSLVRKTQLSSSLICRRANYNNHRPTVSGASLLIGNNESKNIVESNSSLEIVQISSKAKRPRKQQLTSVNRGDSEIIIQPAIFPSEDDESTKKRGRRKRKAVRSPVYKSKTSAKKVKRARRRRRPRRPVVEVIEIDLDEENETEAGSAKKTIVEITIDENKEKGSSDKENEVIMVGDSDEEIEQSVDTSNTSSSILKCEHCSRSFRQRRALDTHSRICPKSPDAMRRLKERSSRRNLTRLSKDDMPVAKKEFLCKICQEKFDVVVALARHVRFIHSLKKKTANQTIGMNKSNEETVAVETTPVTSVEPTETISEIAPAMIVTPTTRRRRKRRKANSPNHSWKGQKLHCTDCGKWFSSDALLAAHCLQHATKQSQKQLRRCQTCKKLLKSRVLYIRHMKMHSRAKKLQKRLHHTRQAAGKLSSLRTRGRPQKL